MDGRYDGKASSLCDLSVSLSLDSSPTEGSLWPKEHVKVEAATQTFATITLQNYFRMYHKLGALQDVGFNGLTDAEEQEFYKSAYLDQIQEIGRAHV